MKKLWLLLCPFVCLQAQDTSLLSTLFDSIPAAKVLEFGIGDSTHYLLHHCEELTSVEFVLPSQGSKRFAKCQQTLQGYWNWDPILLVANPQWEQAEALALEQKDPSLYDGSYLFELKDLYDSLFASQTYDVVYVKPALHLRGDMVNELFGRVPVIIAPDTNHDQWEYGWFKVCTPFDYVRIDESGTTFWIHKSKQKLLQQLIPNYVPPKPKKLRIFFPDMHIGVTHSMLAHCKQFGHTLLLPDSTFSLSHPQSGPKFHYPVFTRTLENLPEKFHDCVEIVSNQEILKTPPDVLFLNCHDVEADVLYLDHLLSKKWKRYYKTKLAHYSGNNSTPYTFSQIKNLITADATTALQYDLDAIHYGFWIPWIDWDSMQYTGPNGKGKVYSYLGHHYSYEWFFPARDVYTNFTSLFETTEGVSLFDLQKMVEQSEMYRCMEQSMATLHIKNLEGFGYTIIESMAKGRPVFLKRSYSLGKKLMNWSVPNRTALFFDTYEEFYELFHRFLTDEPFRTEWQNKTAHEIRRFINNDRQALVLENFLQNLK